MSQSFLDPWVGTGSRKENASDQKIKRVCDSIKKRTRSGLLIEHDPSGQVPKGMLFRIML
jgi:hypothetical protein